MQEPIFLELAHSCLKVVEPQEEPPMSEEYTDE